MRDQQKLESASGTPEVAFLVIRSGNAKGDVYRLQPGQVTSLGRSPTNRIVIRDEVCSRNHCEIFLSGSVWALRDLESRNGTLVNDTLVKGDWPLHEGQTILIGDCEVSFTFDLSRQMKEMDQVSNHLTDTDTALDLVLEQDISNGPAIIHRASQSRYRESDHHIIGRDRASQELAGLYRLGLDMAAAADSNALSEVVLEGLFSGTVADIGAILLLPKSTEGPANPTDLGVVTYNSRGNYPYQKVSDSLTQQVLSSRDAVLAKDVLDDSRLASRDSLGEIQAQSLICAPIQVKERIYGLIHLYSTNPENQLDPDDLEYTLALADQFAVALESLKQREFLAKGLARVKGENQTLREQLNLESEMVGDSRQMQKLKMNMERIARTEATVLVRGESGVGKELVARGIHFSSNRTEHPLVCMNCAALNESLLESELFGHEKGAFTGATGLKVGKFEQADKGTLFLDEVGEMSLPVQAKFLRVLEGHPFERVGGGTSINVDVRVVAATNRDLEKSVKEGTFRKDLYFRLHVVEVMVESLRNRPDDIPLLAEYFLKKNAKRSGICVTEFTADAMNVLISYSWPGNVRELQNVIERTSILCPNEYITAGDIQLSALNESDKSLSGVLSRNQFRPVSLEAIEKEHILATLEQTNWNKSKASQILGIERSTLDRKLKRYQVNRPTK